MAREPLARAECLKILAAGAGGIVFLRGSEDALAAITGVDHDLDEAALNGEPFFPQSAAGLHRGLETERFGGSLPRHRRSGRIQAGGGQTSRRCEHGHATTQYDRAPPAGHATNTTLATAPESFS